MTNIYTLKNINNKGDGSFRGIGQRLGGSYEQELKEKLYSALISKAEINDLSEKLLVKYLEREKESQRTYADIGNKISQLNASSIKKASSVDKIQILSLETEIRELEGKLEDLKLNQSFHNSNKGDLNSKEYTIECIEKGIEETHEITSWKLDDLFSARLNLTKENSRLREIITKKDNKIADLSNPPLPPMNDSSQKLPGWVSDNLRPLVYKLSLENKVMELNKRFVKENILEALQELLPQNEMISKSRVSTETISQVESLPNQFIHS
ncbi:hypothetical protein RclHR1_09810002 [Rhizophagus clarus]|uniref:Uncharacterized protein n=1 Tax=Rhizophagus clarus TaxID=94130 RepID=A0A2Z6S5N1_9GLOM|nr:hypothetical protein RclHR1_09810002 [Rhizophagus clarus]GES93736.1 hypothetical protein GLOIN_2v1763802 [Rhizophagus clarus]